MKLAIFFLILTGLFLSVNGCAQRTVTLSERNASLIKVFKEIKRQTGFSYMLTRELLVQADRINIEVRNVSLADALEIIFRDQPLTYVIVGKTIVVKERVERRKVVLVAGSACWLPG